VPGVYNCACYIVARSGENKEGFKLRERNPTFADERIPESDPQNKVFFSL